MDVSSDNFSQGNKCRFSQIFVEALKEFPNLFIQSETSANTYEYSESHCASKYVMLLSNFGDQHCRLIPISEAGFCDQLVLVPLTDLVIIFFILITCIMLGNALILYGEIIYRSVYSYLSSHHDILDEP